MKYLSVEEIILTHEYQLQMFGGIPGVRSIELLESALFRPQTSFDGKDLYETVFLKAASLFHSLVKNHPFVDGNKRTGFVSAVTFLRANGYKFSIKQSDSVTLTLEVESGDLSLEQIAKKFEKHSAKIN